MTDLDEDNPLQDVAKEMPNAPVPTAPGIAAIALSLAMKYHDINTVQDGALYQQYKLEGKNMTPLHLDMVFETAMRIERHMITANERIAGIVMDAIAAGAALDEETDSTDDEDSEK